MTQNKNLRNHEWQSGQLCSRHKNPDIFPVAFVRISFAELLHQDPETLIPLLLPLAGPFSNDVSKRVSHSASTYVIRIA